MSTPRFTHNAFPTPRLDACVAFYVAFAGMRVVKRRGEPGERVFWLAPGAAELPIFVLVENQSAADESSHDDPLLRHLGFDVASRAEVDALHARLHAAGHQTTPPVYVDEVVGYLIMTRDPDGRVVEFSCGQDVSPKNWDAANWDAANWDAAASRSDEADDGPAA